MFETSQECILDTLEPQHPSKNQICSNFGFFSVFHTPILAIFERPQQWDRLEFLTWISLTQGLETQHYYYDIS